MAIIEQHQVGTGFEAQVVGGNKSFYAAIEGKKLRELTFPDSTAHDWTLPAAVKGAAHTRYSQGYCYELYDRGKGGPAAEATVHLHKDEVYPSVYARAVWEQIFVEAGFRWAGPLPEVFDRLLLPATALPTYGEEVRNAAKLVAGIDSRGDKNRIYGRPYEGRDEVVRTVPYDYTNGQYGYLAPTMPGVYSPATYRWKAPFVCYINVSATTTAVIGSPYGSARAQVFVYINGQEIAGGERQVSKKSSQDKSYLTPSVSLSKYLVQQGDEVEIRLKLTGQDSQGIFRKWGYESFTGYIYTVGGNALPLDSFSVEILPDLPPVGASVCRSRYPTGASATL
ncbi:hypothetical protein DNI29_06615 [Hymenobacter sediminis]|uniref:hypothetical protein n=1 Tax=Hymenobacter sediminis TaxID=2218621 RepID=UPI000F4E80A4|nr:hypothetical protein [Hymenobacter sediminis]RPD48295.1 hypothetical protein DNI29_06615 [Hymenobacter sediminis]